MATKTKSKAKTKKARAAAPAPEPEAHRSPAGPRRGSPKAGVTELGATPAGRVPPSDIETEEERMMTEGPDEVYDLEEPGLDLAEGLPKEDDMGSSANFEDLDEFAEAGTVRGEPDSAYIEDITEPGLREPETEVIDTGGIRGITHTVGEPDLEDLADLAEADAAGVEPSAQDMQTEPGTDIEAIEPATEEGEGLPDTGNKVNSGDNRPLQSERIA